jgi:hypothetical protein
MQKLGAYLSEKLGSLDEEHKRFLLVRLAQGVTCLLLIVGVYFGVDRLQQRVHALERYDRPLYLEWEGLPDWLQIADNRHILDDLAGRVKLDDSDRQLDPMLAERIGKSLASPELGWIQSVERVRVRPDGVVSVRCAFRRPAAWIRRDKSCYLVDQNRIRLPGRYEAADCRGSALLSIVGVQAPPPAVGQIWQGTDIGAGIGLVSLLNERSFRHQLVDIVVSNFNGRSDPAKPYIEMTTDRPDSRIWWGRPPGQEHGTEINATQKLTLLETLYRQWGRVDMNRSYVNITTWPDRVAMPMTIQPQAQARLLRG